jgi:hypothetical protein
MAGRKRSEAEQELDDLAGDWIALWQSEIAGLMADPELAEAWAALVGLGTAWLRALAPSQSRPDFPFPFRTPAHDPQHGSPWPAPAAAASATGGQPRRDGPDDTANAGSARDEAANDAALAERVARLERQLAELERRQAGSGANCRPARRRRTPA